MKAWVFQDAKERGKRGARACPWSVGWIDDRGKRRQRTIGAKTTAKAYARKLEGEAAAGLLKSHEQMKWGDFRRQFERDHTATLRPSSQQLYKHSLDHFQRLVAPAYVDQIGTATVDEYRAKRLAEGVSVATVNRDLRHLRCALNKAKDWSLLKDTVKVQLLREPERDQEFIDDAMFAKLYESCESMRFPDGQHYTADEWWKALLTFAFLTGWRIREILALRRDEVDLEAGIATLKAEKTKGNRDVRIELHPVVVEHLRAIVSFDELVFRWPKNERLLWTHFAGLKKAAGVEIKGAFHRLRFGFSNANVDRFGEDVLQHLMRHKNRQTTRRYVHAAKRMQRQGTAEKIHVPAVLTATG